MKTLILAAIRCCSLMFTAVAALSVAHPAKANLITNPGFEDIFTGWTVAGNVGFDFSGNAAHSGFIAAFLGDSTGVISQSVATTAGATYTIDFFANAVSGAGSTLTVTFGTTVFNYLFTGTGYTEITFNATVLGANTDLSFHDATGGIFLDDVSVNPAGVGVPDGGSTVSLLGFGLLGLAALRRRLGR